MGDVLDYETGKPLFKAEPPCEGADGLLNIDVELEDTSSNPFPWVTAIQDTDGRCFVRTQTGHDSFIDTEITKRNASALISILANFLAR